MLASGTPCVEDIAKLPDQIASKLLISTNFADIASNAPHTFTIDFESSFLRRFSLCDNKEKNNSNYKKYTLKT